MTDKLIVVWTTLPDEDSARLLARALVTDGLVACAQFSTSSICSIYRWNAEIQEDSEIRLSLKTRREHWARLCDRIRELHPYELPQIVGAELLASTAYASWVGECTEPS